MKKTFFTLMLLAVVTLLSAQTLQFEHDGHVYENGETIICPFNEDYGEYVIELKIRNLSDNNMNIVVEQEVLEAANGIMMQLCWGVCMSTIEHVVTRPLLVPAQTLSNDVLALHCSFLEGETGVVTAVYHAYDESDPDSKISITVLYGQNAGTDEYTVNLGQAYPNPASSQVHFDFSGNGNSSVKAVVYNLLGQEVKSQFVNGVQGRITFTVDDLQPGIYFCSFQIDNEMVRTEKFIVKR